MEDLFEKLDEILAHLPYTVVIPPEAEELFRESLEVWCGLEIKGKRYALTIAYITEPEPVRVRVLTPKQIEKKREQAREERRLIKQILDEFKQKYGEKPNA